MKDDVEVDEHGKSDKRRSYFGALRSWAAYGVAPLVGLITAPLLARSLGAEGRGELAAVLQPLTIADAFAAAGIPAAVAFYVAKGKATEAVRRAAYQLVLVSGVAITLLLLWYAAVLDGRGALPLSHTLPFWLTVVWLGALVAVRRASLQGAGRYSRLDGERIVSAVLRLAFIAGLFVLGVTSSVVFVAAYLIAGVLAWTMLADRRTAGRIRENEAPRHLGGASGSAVTRMELLKFGAVASVGGLGATIGARLDQALLPAILSTSGLGIYSVAVTVSEVPLIVATVTARNILTEVSSGNRTAVRRTLLVGALGVAVSNLLIVIAAPMVIPTVFGDGFAAADTAVRLLLVATVGTSVTTVAGAYLIGRGRPGLSAWGPVTSAVVTTVGLSAWAAQMSVNTAAVIASLAQLAGCAVALLAIRHANASKRSRRQSL